MATQINGNLSAASAAHVCCVFQSPSESCFTSVVFVSMQVEADSIAGRDGRIHEGDQILQVSGSRKLSNRPAVVTEPDSRTLGPRLSQNHAEKLRILHFVFVPTHFERQLFLDQDGCISISHSIFCALCMNRTTPMCLVNCRVKLRLRWGRATWTSSH